MGRGTKAQRLYEDAVAYACRNAGMLRELIGPAHWDAPFAVVRDGEPATAEWCDAVRALHDAAEAAGIPGGLGLRSTMGVGEWPPESTPRSTGWVCPTGRCSRVDLQEETAPEAAVCALADGPMRRVD